MDLRPQYILAPCGWEQGAKWHHIRVGSGTGEITFGSLLLFAYLRFPTGNFARYFSGLPIGELYWSWFKLNDGNDLPHECRMQ